MTLVGIVVHVEVVTVVAVSNERLGLCGNLVEQVEGMSVMCPLWRCWFDFLFLETETTEAASSSRQTDLAASSDS